jgi:hypothetical protein
MITQVSFPGGDLCFAISHSSSSTISILTFFTARGIATISSSPRPFRYSQAFPQSSVSPKPVNMLTVLNEGTMVVNIKRKYHLPVFLFPNHYFHARNRASE